jgi:hypothetical protein
MGCEIFTRFSALFHALVKNVTCCTAVPYSHFGPVFHSFLKKVCRNVCHSPVKKPLLRTTNRPDLLGGLCVLSLAISASNLSPVAMTHGSKAVKELFNAEVAEIKTQR